MIKLEFIAIGYSDKYADPDLFEAVQRVIDKSGVDFAESIPVNKGLRQTPSGAEMVEDLKYTVWVPSDLAKDIADEICATASGRQGEVRFLSSGPVNTVIDISGSEKFEAGVEFAIDPEKTMLERILARRAELANKILG